MATGIQIFKEANDLINEHGLDKAKEIMESTIRFTKNSTTRALWEAALNTIISSSKKSE